VLFQRFIKHRYSFRPNSWGSHEYKKEFLEQCTRSSFDINDLIKIREPTDNELAAMREFIEELDLLK
jgi:hypothetical protein